MPAGRLGLAIPTSWPMLTRKEARHMADYVLEIVEGPEAGRTVPLTGPVELGRDAGAGIALMQDDLLSRRHVRITPEEGGARV